MPGIASTPPAATAPPPAAPGRWRLSLRARLILLVLVGVFPLLGFILVGEFLEYQERVERTGHETLAKAHDLAATIDAELQARINVLQVLATEPSLRNGDLVRFRARAVEVMAEQYPGSNIVLLRQDGSQLMNLAAPAGTALPPRPHVETVRLVFATGGPAVSDLYHGAVLRRPVVSIDAPVKDYKGRVIGVLSMVPAAATFDDMIRRLRLDGRWIVTVFDRRYAIIARSHDPHDHIGQTATGQLQERMRAASAGIHEGGSRDSIPMLAVFARSQSFGWSVAIGVPRAELARPAVDAALRALIFAGTLLGIGLVLATIASRRISGPIGALRDLAAATEGDAALPLAGTGLAETDDVANALRAAQEGRRRSERRFRTLFEANPLALCVYDLDSLRLLEVNDTVTAQYGWSRRELLGMTVQDLYPPEHRDTPLRLARERRRGPYTLKQWRKDGSQFEIEAVARVVELDGRRRGLAISHDITQRKAMEEQLRQAQKMETFGQLAGGVAHDFNNSLAVVMGSLEEVLDAAAGDGEVHAAAETAMAATQHAASLTRRLLAFSRRQELAPLELDVAAVAQGLERILRSAVTGSIDVAVRVEAQSCHAVLDRTQLETAILNLVVNARDAIDDHGTIGVEIGRRHIGEAEAQASPALRAGDWVVVAVSDDGQGMSEAVRARIFEPFFTTKEVGKGTGLGLSQIHGFVAQSGGFITVESTPGAGTRIALHFPSAAAIDAEV